MLRIATADNANLLALSDPRRPYPGKLGVIEAGALAGLFLVDSDPFANLALVETPATSLQIIMKGDRVYMDTSA